LIPFLVFLTLSEIIDKESIKFEYVSEQMYDESCGLAAVSTLLQYYDVHVNEETLLNGIFIGKDDSFGYRINLNNLSNLLTHYNIINKPVKSDFNQLLKSATSYYPVIVHYNYPDLHFAVLLGSMDSKLVFADPARGLEVLSYNQFNTRWSGIVVYSTSKIHSKNEKKLSSSIEKSIRRARLLEKLSWR